MRRLEIISFNSWVLIMVVIALASCVSLIDLETQNTAGQISIYGHLTNSSLYDQPVHVRRSTSNRGPSRPIENATVVIVDENGVTYPYEYEDSLKYYLPNDSFVGVPGIAYQLTVMLEGEVFQSTFETMPASGGIDRSEVQFARETLISDVGATTEQHILRILTTTQLPAGPPVFLKWDIEQVYVQTEITLPKHVFPFSGPRNCYIKEPLLPDNLLLFDGSEVLAQSLEDQVMIETLLNQNLDTAGGFGIIQHSMTQEALAYWKKVDQVANRVGSLFEVPPAPIPGNISNLTAEDQQVLGFFEVSKVDTSGVFIVAEDIPVFLGNAGVTINCQYAQEYLAGVPFQCFTCLQTHLGVPEACYNCLSLPDATLERPTYLDR